MKDDDFKFRKEFKSNYGKEVISNTIEDCYIPFTIDGISIDDCEFIYSYYKSKLLDCDSIKDMIRVGSKFKFLFYIGFKDENISESLSGIDVNRVKELLNKSKPTEEELNNSCLIQLILPLVMFNAGRIARV